MRPTPAAQVLRAAAGSDGAACVEVYAWLREVVPRMLRRCGVRSAVPEDLVHDIATDAMLGLASFRADCAFDTWVFRIVRNTIADWVSGRGRVEVSDSDAEDFVAALVDDRPSSSEKLDRIAGYCTLSTCIQLLSCDHPRQTVCLLAVTFWGFAVADVATKLGLTRDLVWQDVCRGRMMLHDKARELGSLRGARRPAFLAPGCPFESVRATFA
ncbi:MAG: hypothetical protein HY905_26835 [Deltaproteobacteria bacterium]|nr:hypothetical protein [Deltaproteobacteria bacterium]